MSAERIASRVPRHPSNRSFMEQMIAWGWTPGKTDGSWLSMHSPPIGQKQVRVRIRPATQHDANPTSVFLEVYRLTCAGDAELFWRGPSDTWLQMLANERAKAEERKRQEYEEGLRRAAARAEAQAAEAAAKAAREQVTVRRLAAVETPEGEVVTETATATKDRGGRLLPKEAREKMGRPTERTIHANHVLEILTAHDGPMSIKTICERLGVDHSAVGTYVSNACRYLVFKGYATRVMKGTYRITDQGKTIGVRIQHDGIHAAGPTTTAAVTQQQGGGAETAPAPAQPVAHVTESIDDTIEAVLDLLLPNGFNARHLRFIAPWAEATKRMVEEVRGN